MIIKKHARAIAFVVLAAVSGYYGYRFLVDDWPAALATWRGKGGLLLGAVLLSFVEVGLDMICWMWVYSRSRIKSWDALGVGIYFTKYAGEFLPMQLGRLVRPDGVVRLGRGTLKQATMAEGVAFYLDTAALFCTIAASASWMICPWSFPFVLTGAILAALFLAHRAAVILSGTWLALPTSFWWRWQTVAIILLGITGWILHGVILYMLLWDLPGEIGLVSSVFYSSASTVIGASSGLPGGIGTTEGFLGWFLSLLEVPGAHVALTVGVFRMITFWIDIPLGWIAVVWISSKPSRETAPPKDADLAGEEKASP